MIKLRTFISILFIVSVQFLNAEEKPVHLFVLSGQSNMVGVDPETGFMPEAKKLFKDEKFSQFEKESQWLLCDSSGTIVWVIGQRADRRFKVSDKTLFILKISLKNKLDF